MQTFIQWLQTEDISSSNLKKLVQNFQAQIQNLSRSISPQMIQQVPEIQQFLPKIYQNVGFVNRLIGDPRNMEQVKNIFQMNIMPAAQQLGTILDPQATSGILNSLGDINSHLVNYSMRQKSQAGMAPTIPARKAGIPMARPVTTPVPGAPMARPLGPQPMPSQRRSPRIVL